MARRRLPAALIEAVMLATLGFGVVLVTDLPYAAGRARQSDRLVFSGLVDLEEDHNQYYAYVRQAAEGAGLFANRLTYVPHAPALFNLQWWLAGRAMGTFDLSMPATHEAWRITGVLALVLAIHTLARAALDDPVRRWLATGMGCLGGGFGWAFVLGGRAEPLSDLVDVPWADVNVPVHPFFQMISSPHFPLPLALFFSTIALLALAERRGSRSLHAWAAAAAVVDGLMRPYDLIILWTILPLYGAWQTWAEGRCDPRRLAARLLPLIATAPLLAYYAALFRLHPVFGQWYGQSELPPPAWYNSLLSYGLASLLLGLRLLAWRRRPIRGPVDRLLFAWFVGLFLLARADAVIPFSFQLGDPVLPAILLGAAVLPGLESGSGPPRWLAPAAIAASIVVVHALSSVVVVGAMTRRVETTARFFVPRAEMQALRWAAGHLPPGDLVLCRYERAVRLPTYAPVRVPVGHYASSPLAARTREEVAAFFSGTMSGEEMARLLDRYGAAWIFLGPEDRAGRLPHEDVLPVEAAYEAGGFRILRVDR